MIKIMKAFPLLLMVFSCSTINYLDLNSKIKEEGHSVSRIFIPSGALVNSFDYVDNGIKYNIGISSQGKIIYISTTDEKFDIDGIKINSKLPEEYWYRKLEHISGWGYYLKIDSEWFAGFDFQTRPNEESEVEWIFKYDFNEASY